MKSPATFKNQKALKDFRKVLCFLFIQIIFLFQTASYAAWFWRTDENSQDIAQKFISRGYDCTEMSSSYYCRGCMNMTTLNAGTCPSTSGYSQRVNFYFSKNLTTAAPIKIAYHIPGWSDLNSNDTTPQDHQLIGEYAAAADSNLIVVLPESRGKNDDHRRLNTRDKFAQFFATADSELVSAGLELRTDTPRVITGHSGAYSIFKLWSEFYKNKTIKQLQNLVGFGLFDTPYAYSDKLTAWYNNQPGHFLYLVAINPKNDASKLQACEKLRAAICPYADLTNCPNFKYIKDAQTAHGDFMREYLTWFYNQALSQHGD